MTTPGDIEKHDKHEEATKLLHQINNQVQIVFGWLELGDAAKAKHGVSDLVKLLGNLSKSLALAPKTKRRNGKH